ncbi:hypothetical protein F4779DRAFT_634715 [Xylariaceae sp. FL0662B]|nr:hypothetical protein F4779DRAFT_634715 [Xylariaceae sp. FL0662B]
MTPPTTKVSSDPFPFPYPFTGLTNQGFPSLTSQQATRLANTLVHLSHNTLPSPRDLPDVLNAYSAREPSCANRGPWAYFHGITDIPTIPEQQRQGQGGGPVERVVLPAAVAQNLQQPFSGVHSTDGGRYRLLVFVHRHRPMFKTRTADAETAYSMTVWDCAQGELMHHDFRATGREELADAVRVWWGAVRLVIEGSDHGSVAAVPRNWVETPAYTALSTLEAGLSPGRLDARTTLYAVLGGAVELLNKIDAAGPLRVTDDADTATGLGIELLPKLYEHLFLMLRAQPRVELRAMAGKAHQGNQYNGRMFHHLHWLNAHLAVVRKGSLFRQRLRDRLMTRVPLTLTLGTVQVLTRRDLSEYARNI